MYIKSPSRLHLGLIDMNGSYGRLDGGIGLTIKDPNLLLYGEPAEKGITIEFDDNFTFTDEIKSLQQPKKLLIIMMWMKDFTLELTRHICLIQDLGLELK